MINVLVYALPNRSGGGLSVIENLYYDLKENAKKFPNIHWLFIMGINTLPNTSNITVINEEGALKTWLHRYWFNKVKLKKFVKEKNIKAVISINMGVAGLDVPSIISFHNVLPFYSCNKEVFDDFYWMIKQRIINWEIIKSVKRAEFVIVPSRWVKEVLVDRFGMKEQRVCVSPITLPEIQTLLEETEISKADMLKHEFIYPASGFPYKNHRVIVEAAKILQDRGIENYLVRFSGITNTGKTIREMQRAVDVYHLPIEFCGNMSKKELVIAYKKGTLIFPSKIETDGFPILESKVCGGSILAADLPYAREALENYDDCQLFDPDNGEELADLMQMAIKRRRTTSRIVRCKDMQPRSGVIVPMIKKLLKKENVGKMNGDEL